MKKLTTWFRNNARALPWRGIRDPYAILVSELMLQQTQVATVIPYFERWMRRFPDPATLAAADENDVLAHWQGLGYYSRARNLHRAARAIVAEHGGKIPRDAAAIRALPGVGRYTAGAVASFAFDLPEPIVDANVARVLARLLDLHTPVDSPAGQRALWDTATALVPSKGAGEFNAALMELGAILCTPRQPACEQCPLRPRCRAHAAGTVATLPVKKPRRKTIPLTEVCAWIFRRGEVLLEYQPGPRWRGMWKLPPFTGEPTTPPLHAAEYPFTHHRISLRVHAAAVPQTLPQHHRWYGVKDLTAIPLTSPHRRAVELLARLGTTSQKV